MGLQLELPPAFYTGLQSELKDVYAQAISEAKRDIGYAKEYLTTKEACELASVSTNTFTNNFVQKGLPVYQIGNKQYIKKKELNEFISQHRIN